MLNGALTGRAYRAPVKKQLVLVVLGLVTVLVLAAQLGRATAGPEPNDIQDSLPAWSSDGVHLAFQRTSPTLSHPLQMTSAGKDLYVDAVTGELRGWVPGTQQKLLQTGDETLVTEGGRFVGPPVVLHGVDASASPDGSRVAYLRGGVLYVSSVDGSGEHALATGIAPPPSDVLGPVWSPDGSRIAVASGSSLLVVGPDERTVGAGVNPSWSPDGKTVAFEREVDSHWQIWGADAGGAGAHELLGGSGSDYRFPQFSPVSGRLAFISDRQHVRGGATPYQFALYVDETRKLVDDVLEDSRRPPLEALAETASRGIAVGFTVRREIGRAHV